MIGDKQCANHAQGIPTVLDQEIPRAIGDEQSTKIVHKDLPIALERRFPKTKGMGGAQNQLPAVGTRTVP